jgi:hypothetical protein
MNATAGVDIAYPAHFPPLHVALDGQPASHAPQLDELLVVSTHVPSHSTSTPGQPPELPLLEPLELPLLLPLLEPLLLPVELPLLEPLELPLLLPLLEPLLLPLLDPELLLPSPCPTIPASSVT